MLSQRSLLLGGLAATLAVLCLQGVHTQMHTQVEIFDDSCATQLDSLWGNYTSPPVAPVAGCDRACLAACEITLKEAIYSERLQNCPLQTEIVRCFHVYRPQWTKFVADCALFQYGTAGGSTQEGESSSSSSSSSSTTAGEGAATTTAAATSEGAATPTTAATSEGAATTTTTAAAAEGAATTAGRRRVLLQEAEAALGNSTTLNVNNGCFPNFADLNDFNIYINGIFVHETSSSAVGITLSVLFFSTLVVIGVGLPKIPWAKLNCFKRKPTKLAPPTAALPTAAIVDSSTAAETTAAAAS